MKKLIALALLTLSLLALFGCASASAATESENTGAQATLEPSNQISGGWGASSDPAVTDELRKVFDQALDGLSGVSYEPIVYRGSQMVAGTNHCFLCQSAVVYPDAEPHYVLMYIYEDLSGGAQIMNIADLDIGAFCEYGILSEEN